MNNTQEYVKIRDNIETVATLAAAALRGTEVLDHDDADSLSDAVRLETADRIWSGLMSGITAIDR